MTEINLPPLPDFVNTWTYGQAKAMQAYGQACADAALSSHTEQEVQQILDVASKGQIGEMDAIESVVRRILGVPKP